jgi:hypothetical protein
MGVSVYLQALEMETRNDRNAKALLWLSRAFVRKGTLGSECVGLRLGVYAFFFGSGNIDGARASLHRAITLEPENAEIVQVCSASPSARGGVATKCSGSAVRNNACRS